MNTAIVDTPALITAAEWFGGGQRVRYDPDHHRMLTASDDVNDVSTHHLMVFERVVGAAIAADAAGRWITILPGFPDGSYGYAKVNALLGDELAPRLYLEYVGQGDSDKPRKYHYSTIERADLVEAQWQAQRSPALFVSIMRSAKMYAPAYGVTDAELLELYDGIARRDGAAFLHLAAGFVAEHKAHARRWDLAWLYHALRDSVAFCVAGSEEDPYEPKQIVAARVRLGAAGLDIRMLPGGHLTTAEHPDLLAALIHERTWAWLQLSVWRWPKTRHLTTDAQLDEGRR